jgi:hypothetical protein
MTAWIDEQVAYWYGSNYSEVAASSWHSIERLLERSDYRKRISRYPTVTDVTVERILECYSGLPDYNTHGNAEVVEDIRKHDITKRLTTAHSLPVLMVDEIGLDLPVISYNRLAAHQSSRVFLWPNSYHVAISQAGQLDRVSFSEKRQTLIFRGALSGPMNNFEIAPGISKVSRAQFILSLPTTTARFDIGITYIPPQLLSDLKYLEIEDQIQKLISDRVPMEKIFEHRYVLCLEGSDISSGFGGVLASNCVPFHVLRAEITCRECRALWL